MDAVNPRTDQLDALLTEFTQRLRIGEQPTVEEYALKYPQEAAAIRELFPTVQNIEELRIQRQARRDWAARNPEAAAAEHGLDPGANDDWRNGATETDWTQVFHPPQAADELGRLGTYRILKLVGRGGMGAVFVAEDLKLNRTVALKVMLPELARKPEARKRFLREARTAASIEHVNIVAIFQVDEDRDVPFIAMPLLKGESLEARLASGLPLSVPQILKIGWQIARGLSAAHARGLIHRDIKPANIWLEAAAEDGDDDGDHVGCIKLLDFGLARPLGESHLTQAGLVVGTPAYMAPEQARGETIDARSDLFSLGVILYLLCTGRLPFQGASTMHVLMALASHIQPAPHTVRGTIPKDLSALIMELLEKDISRRPESAKTVAARLQQIEKDLRDAPTHTAMRGLLPWLTVVVVVAVVGPLGAWLLNPVPRAEPAVPLPDRATGTSPVTVPVIEAEKPVQSPPAPLSATEVLTAPDWEWSAPESLGPIVNSAAVDAAPTISADGLHLVFFSERDGRSGLWETRRRAVDQPFEAPTAVTAPGIEQLERFWDPCLTADGLILYVIAKFKNEHGGQPQLLEIHRPGIDAPWEPPHPVDPKFNFPVLPWSMRLSADGCVLIFGDNGDLSIVNRASVAEAFEYPVNLGSNIKSPNWNWNSPCPATAARCYFCEVRRPENSGWQPARTPATDFQTRFASSSPVTTGLPSIPQHCPATVGH